MNKNNLLNYGDLYFLIFVIIIVTTASLSIYFLSTRSIKFLNQTESKIRFIYRPKFSQSVGVLIAGIGLVFLWATLSLSPITKLDCDRSLENNTLQCKLVEIGIFDNQVSKKEFFEIKSVKVQAIEDEYSSRETTRRYNLLLLTDLGEIPFKRLSSYTKNYKLDSLYQIASSINKFL